MKIKDIQKKVETVVPLELAQDWDNVGLQIGDAQRDVKNILLTVDITSKVLAEAKKLNTGLIISYHPVIWDSLKKLTKDGASDIVYELIRANICVLSVHTALDVVVGGINDMLAEIVGIKEGKPIGDYVHNSASDNCKLVVFIPVKSVNKVSNAMFKAGAGNIGNYSHCSFMTEGEGSFLPLNGARPAIGKKGKLEKVPEIRFEAIVPSDKLERVVSAMIKAHPYEIPAFDCCKLFNPQDKIGLGRIGKLSRPIPLKLIIKNIKKATGAKAIGIVGKEHRIVKKAAVCAGSCGKIINTIISEKADLYVTGELKHHQALAAQEADLTCLCLSHTVSERFILKKLAKQLQKLLKQVKIRISKTDSDPFTWKEL
ncbi:MAG: Nif3-like dinuclear metal center hexameric protein [Planctomycetota bacterium]|jgi:dinuclear metal center YbgI/SA1388 family protein